MHRCFPVDQDSVDIHQDLHDVVLNATIISGCAWIDTTTANSICLFRHTSLINLFLSLCASFSPYSQIRFTLTLVVAHCEIISVGSVPNATIISGLLRLDWYYCSQWWLIARTYFPGKTLPFPSHFILSKSTNHIYAFAGNLPLCY